jgi:hypothetical protein
MVLRNYYFSSLIHSLDTLGTSLRDAILRAPFEEPREPLR